MGGAAKCLFLKDCEVTEVFSLRDGEQQEVGKMGERHRAVELRTKTTLRCVRITKFHPHAYIWSHTPPPPFRLVGCFLNAISTSKDGSSKI